MHQISHRKEANGLRSVNKSDVFEDVIVAHWSFKYCSGAFSEVFYHFHLLIFYSTVLLFSATDIDKTKQGINGIGSCDEALKTY